MQDLTLGQRIALKRNELGLSQSALGEQLGVSRQSVFKWESDAAIPEIDKLIGLSRLFSVSLDWLLGIGDVPRTDAPAPDAPEQDFTDQERQILEKLSRQKPALPQWMKALGIIAVACAAAAMINSCISLSRTSRMQEQVEEYISYIESQILEPAYVVQQKTYSITPSINMDSATTLLRVTPFSHSDGQQAKLTVTLGKEIILLTDCLWNGTCWETEFNLKPVNGYQFLFTLLDEQGRDFTQELDIPVLSQLALNLAWPTTQSVTWEDLDIQDTGFVFTNMHVKIPLPGVFRYTGSPWESCELVLTDDGGNLLASFDLMNRSNYSAEINFDESDVDFTTQSVALSFPMPEVGETLHLTLVCSLSTGHQFYCPVEEWRMQSNGLTNLFHDPQS